MAQLHLLLLWVRSVLDRRQHEGRQRSRGASTVEWVLICVLAATVAAVLGTVLIRWVVSTTNVVRTR